MAQFTLKNVKINFPSLFEKAVFPGNDPSTGKYEVTVIIKKGSENEKLMFKHLDDPDRPAKISFDRAKLLLKDGDDPRDNKSEFEYYKGHWFFKLSSKKRPVTVNQSNSIVTAEDGDHPNGIFYSGAVCNVIGSIWWQNNDFGQHARANLLGIQMVDDNTDSFAGAGESIDAATAFEDLGELPKGW